MPAGRPAKLDWSKVDWSRHDRELARELGVAFQAVHQQRHKLGKPTLPRPCKVVLNWAALDWRKPDAQLARQTGTSHGTVRRHRAGHSALPTSGLVARVHAVDWSRVDWTQRDTQLAKELGMSRTNVPLHRRRLGVAPHPARKPPAARPAT